MLVHVAAVATIAVLATATPPPDGPVAVVQEFFDAMQARDTVRMRATLEPGMRLLNIRTAKGKTVVRSYTADELVHTVGTMKDTWVETMHGAEVRLDGELASVWGTYTFKVNGSVTNCGHNDIDLMLIDDRWQIISFASTIRTENCSPQ